MFLMQQFSNVIGILGVILTLLAYYLLNIGKLLSDSIYYLFLNLFGSLMLIFSLFFHWNLASFLVELAWILISVIGIYRARFTAN